MKMQLKVFWLFVLMFASSPFDDQLRLDCCHAEPTADSAGRSDTVQGARKWSTSTTLPAEQVIGDIPAVVGAAEMHSNNSRTTNKARRQRENSNRKGKVHGGEFPSASFHDKEANGYGYGNGYGGGDGDFELHLKRSARRLIANDSRLPVPSTEVSQGATDSESDSDNDDRHVKGRSAQSRVTARRRHITPEKLLYTKELAIKQGRLMGIVRRFQPGTGLRDVDQYLGLPYAEAPVAKRRFMPPGTPLPWQDLRIARHLPPVCPQKLPNLTAPDTARMSHNRRKHLIRLMPYLRNESEDCLYLNLYVPHVDSLLEASKLRPVLVYIHGESFVWNSGNAYDGSVLASYSDVIVVTVNYRLGVFGFLRPSFDEHDIANYALLDQIAALHWIKENIGFFGGDSSRVTLMGHSQGAACINYLMVSPVAAGLFHRAILMSGSALSDWAVSNHTLDLTARIASALGCPLDDGANRERLLACLHQKR